MSANPEPLLNLAEAAAWLGIGQSTLRLRIYEGKGPVAIRLPGSDRWRFRPSDLQAYLEASIVQPPAEPPAPYPSIAKRRALTAARNAKAKMDLARQEKVKELTPEPVAPKPKRPRERERVTA